MLKVPFTIVDATVYTEAGYVGEDVENMLVRLLQVANYDVSKAKKGSFTSTNSTKSPENLPTLP